MAIAVQPQLLFIPISKIKTASNVRQKLGDLDELRLSIQTFGVLQPLAVRPENGGWSVIAGHRRLAAATQAGLKEVPCLVREDLTAAPLLIAQLIENLQRVDLDPLEEAAGYKKLVGLDLKQKAIAEKVGRSEAHVSKRLALLELPREVHDLVNAGKLAIADALELSPYAADAEVVTETLKHVREAIRNGWGFRVSDHARGAARRIEEKRKREAAIAKLTAAGTTIVKGGDYGLPSGSTALGKGYGSLPMSTADHAKGDCHGAFVSADGQVIYVCTKLANHKDSKDKAVTKAIADIKRNSSINSPSRGDSHAAKEQAKKAAESRLRNKVLREREPIRTEELTRVLNAKQKREDVVDFILRQLLQRFLDESHEVEALAATILGVGFKPSKHSYERAKVDWPTWLSGGKDRIFKLAYAVALASGEHPFRHLLKQGYFDGEYVVNAGRYLEHLKSHGYKAEKFELAQLGKPANAYQWRAEFDRAPKKEKAS